ncbi:unnamed protein product [Calypogeia fissa]
MAPTDGSKQKGMRAPLQRAIRRQVAQILRKVVHGDERRASQASIKSLIYEPSIVAKKATLALTCRCLKYLPVLKEIVAATDLLSGKKKVPAELIYVITCDMLFGQEVFSSGVLEAAVLKRKSSLQAALSRLLVKKQVKSVEDLVGTDLPNTEAKIPRYVRVNTLKINFEEALKNLQKNALSVRKDDIIPDLLVMPSGTDLHEHPLVLDGSLLLQGKASCMPAYVLAPKVGWEVVDACAAPGNKTVHLSALLQGSGKIYACEKNSKRVHRLRETVKLTGANNVEIRNEDFLGLIPGKPPFSKVQAILLDPSCSGSGTAQQRLDHLLPSSSKGSASNEPELQRLEQLAQFQERALFHALSFPAVERVVYSTCSIHQRENEDVIKAVLPQALSLGFQLETALPDWKYRGLPIFDGAHHLVRTDSVRDHMDGFFVALFVRQNKVPNHLKQTGPSRPLEAPSIHSEDQLPPQKEIRQGAHEVSEAGKLSKLRRRKLKRQRKKQLQDAADGKT